MCFIFIHIPTSYTIAILWAKYLKVETFAIHLQAFWFLTVASHILHFFNFIQSILFLCTTSHLSSWLRHSLWRIIKFLDFWSLKTRYKRRQTFYIFTGRQWRDWGVSSWKFSTWACRIQNFLCTENIWIYGKVFIRLLLDMLIFFIHSIINFIGILACWVIAFNNGCPLKFIKHLVLKEDPWRWKREDIKWSVFLIDCWIVLYYLWVMI